MDPIWQHVVDLALTIAPDAELSESYGLPALRVDGKPLVGVGTAAKHRSLMVFSPAALELVRADLPDFQVTKGLIRFTEDRPVPDEIVLRLVQARLAEIR